MRHTFYFSPSLIATIQDRCRNRKDERVARRLFPEFKRFLRRFREFVVPFDKDNTLHGIALSELCRRNTNDFEKFRLIPPELFNQWCYYLNSRIEQQPPSLTNLVATVSEFDSLVSSYTNDCVLRIFERFPQDLRPLLTDAAKRSLNSFQQQFVRFLDDYTEYLKNLDESLTTAHISGYYFPRPKPL